MTPWTRTSNPLTIERPPFLHETSNQRVGGDAHHRPGRKSDYTLFFGEFVTSQWGDVDIAPYEPPGGFSNFRKAKQKIGAAFFAAPVFLFAEQSPLLTETADLRVYDLSVFNVNRAAEVLGVIAACQRIGIF